jgi:hypothetical protein
MANVNVYTGADGSVTLSTPEGSEGEAAQSVIDGNDLISVGRVNNVKIEVHSEVRAFHEIGQRYATELRPGNISIRGTIGRAYLNGAMLRLLLGEAADGRPSSSWAQPAFNITLMVKNPASPGASNTITLHGVKIDTWNYDMPEDEFLMESVSFQALYMTTADETA